MPAIPFKPFNRDYGGVTKMIYRVKWATRKSKNVKAINDQLKKNDPNHPVKKAHAACDKDGLTVEGVRYRGGKKETVKVCPSIYFKSYLRDSMKAAITPVHK
jgi:hypothetical protein